MKAWVLMIFLFSLILGCHAVEGLQELREKANSEGRRILENADAYVQKAEMIIRGAERACFSYFQARLQKGIDNQSNGVTRGQDAGGR
jgi:hypothetical protein